VYPGPRRPDEEVALLSWVGVEVIRIDGQQVDMGHGWNARLALLPGRHEITFIPDDAPSPRERACVDLEPDHHYVLHVTAWMRRFYDTDDEVRMPMECAPSPGDEDQEETERPVVSGFSKKRPGTGFSFLIGGQGGGHTLATLTDEDGERTVKAGQGLTLGIGGMLTPLWLGRAVGLGVGADLGFVGDSAHVGNLRTSLVRFPLALTAHVLTNFTGHSPNYLLVRAGASRELWGRYHAPPELWNAIDADVTGSWAPTFSVGFYRRLAPLLAVDFRFFATFRELTIGGTKVGANSYGGALVFHLDF